MNLQLEWEAYERGMCERGSGCTQEQRIGAAVALSWVQARVDKLEAEDIRLRAALVDQLNALEVESRLRAAIRKKLEDIVCTEGYDRGVVLLSSYGPTHYDVDLKMQVYDHESFSPLGDALIDLYELAGGKLPTAGQ